ncbi:Eukaryotic translation initiation factor 5A-1 [Capsicum baccatum]|uniref:Eukaryotic translation initiation factor 5A-1 n=1 Tax=Capsicum baccatum TaxID=33114 RepID=A0A2G2WK40_CAPBA|nr:Eukaryotic translation initiation factor 5A-1 [Capsicum baccatum]
MMELKSRQDLISRLYNIVVPFKDEITFEVYINNDAMDHVVVDVAKKKLAKIMQKEITDIQRFALMVVELFASKTGKHSHAKCHFVAIGIFTGKKLLEDIVPSSHNCDVSVLTKNGNTKDDLRHPTDDTLLAQVKDGFAEWKNLVLSVMSAMGEKQICGIKDIGPK